MTDTASPPSRIFAFVNGVKGGVVGGALAAVCLQPLVSCNTCWGSLFCFVAAHVLAVTS